MKIQSQLEIDAPAETVWYIVAHQFEQIGEWASNIASSARNNDAIIPKGADVGGRVCEVPGMGQIKETFTHFDNKKMSYTYIAGGGPFFMRSASNSWTVTAVNPNQSMVHFDAELIIKPPFRILLSLPIRWQINRLLRETTEELKFYIETGNIHPRKLAQLTKSGRLALD